MKIGFLPLVTINAHGEGTVTGLSFSRKRSDKLVMLGEAEMRHFAHQAILDVAWPIPLQRRAKAGAA